MSTSALPLGLDVSNHQGYIDWSKVAAAGVKFAFMKASQDTDFTDAYFAANWKGAKEHGLYRGAYHYARPDINPDARTEADHCYDVVTQLGGLEPGDMIALDMEVDGRHNFGDWTLYWLQVMESYVNFKPLIYTAPNYINTLNLKNPGLGDYGLWIASWNPNMPKAPAPWPFVAFWQYSASGRVPGINGDVDMNRFNGAVIDIPKYGMPKPIDPPKPQVDIDGALTVVSKTVSQAKVLLDDMETDVRKLLGK